MQAYAPAPSARPAPGIVRVPSWQAFPWLRAGFSTRQGGRTTVYSTKGPAEQNLGWTDADDPAIVAENRRRFIAAATGLEAAASPARAGRLVTIRQVHGGNVCVVRARDEPLETPEGKAVLEGDGLLCAQPGILLGIQTADCVPVLLADTRTRAVAAFHAGWRGTVARIVEHGVAAMQQELGCRPADLIAAIGPAIRPCCFAIGTEVRSSFEREFAYAPALFAEVPSPAAPPAAMLPPQVHMDLHEANRRQLLDAGLPATAITLIAECTACARLADGRRRYFSHRADQGFTGRMLSVVGTTA